MITRRMKSIWSLPLKKTEISNFRNLSFYCINNFLGPIQTNKMWANEQVLKCDQPENSTICRL